jgi:DNA-3-methyladenine glycosylase II
VLRACGLSQAKLLSIRDLTARALDGRLDVAHLQHLPDADVAAQLVAVRGIGKWTADMFLMFALGRPDVLSAEDLGIQNAVEKLYRLDAHPAPAVVRRLAAEGNWHPYATAACFHLWDSLG